MNMQRGMRQLTGRVRLSLLCLYGGCRTLAGLLKGLKHSVLGQGLLRRWQRVARYYGLAIRGFYPQANYLIPRYSGQAD